MKRTGKKLISLAMALILLLAVLPGSALAADLKVNSISADKPSAAVGQKITWTATASGGTGSYRYCFYVFKDNKILERGSYGTANTYSYTPTAGGSYTVRVYVKDSANTVVNKMSTAITVANAPIAVSLTVDKARAAVNEKVTWTVSASGGTGSFQYCFYLFKDGKIKERGSYGAAKTKAYTPTEAGTYTVRVYVKDSAGTVKTQEGGKCVAFAPIVLVSFKPDTTSEQDDLPVTWTAEVAGGTGALQYCFYIYRYGKIYERGSYSASNTYSTTLIYGEYTARVYVKDSAGTTAVFDCGGEYAVDIYAAYVGDITVTAVSPNTTTTFSGGETVTWTADASGGYIGLQYCFYLFANGKIQSRSGWQTENTFSHMTEPYTVYHMRVYVKDYLPEHDMVVCESTADCICYGA